ncbi:MAG TPA: mechanosensitive ion channel family protein [Cyclobacteriaceae bacterium]
MDRSDVIYLLTVGLIGPTIIYIINLVVAKTVKKRRSDLPKADYMTAVATSSPEKNYEEAMERGALLNINNRFSIIQKTLSVIVFVIWVLLLILPFLDRVPTTIISILIASSAVIIGIASKPFIENFISGILLSFNKPFRIGDTVIIDQNYGTIEDVTLTHIIVKIWNWRRLIIPNTLMLTKEFVNCTLKDTYQWARVEFWVSYDTPPDKIKRIAVQATKDSQYFENFEEPSFWIMEMGKEGYRCWVAGWGSSPSNVWELSNDIRKQMIIRFQEEGIKTHQHAFKNDLKTDMATFSN